MARWNWRFLVWTVVGIVLGSAALVHAADLLPGSGTWSLGLRAGYGSSLDNRDIEMASAHFHIGYALFKGQPWIIPNGVFEIGIEPFGSALTSVGDRKGADGSTEYGLALPILTYYFNLGNSLSPYIMGGLGVMYKDLRGYNLGGKFTFMETAGLGLAYFLNQNIAISAEWRFRHMSNASIYKENAGLNSSIFLAGFSYYLPNY